MMNEIFRLVGNATGETLVMVFASTLFSLLLGLPLGIILCVTGPEEQGGIISKPLLNNVMAVKYSFIHILCLFFQSRIIVDQIDCSYEVAAQCSAPLCQIIESALKEVDPGVVQAARAMGSTPMQIILKVLLPEAMPALVSGVTLTIINLIGYSAMAGAIGGGGLGDLAIRYGYQRFRPDVMFFSVVVILILVECIQLIGNTLSARLMAKR